MNAYVSIGNSDDRLTQREWSWFIASTQRELQERWQIHGCWYSAPDSEWQNANWCIELNDVWGIAKLKELLRELAKAFRQDSIALAVAMPEFVEPLS